MFTLWTEMKNEWRACVCVGGIMVIRTENGTDGLCSDAIQTYFVPFVFMLLQESWKHLSLPRKIRDFRFGYLALEDNSVFKLSSLHVRVRLTDVGKRPTLEIFHDIFGLPKSLPINCVLTCLMFEFLESSHFKIFYQRFLNSFIIKMMPYL